MKRCIPLLVALVTLIAFSTEAFAWLIPFSKERIAATGKYCVHGYDGNLGSVGKYFAGDAAAFNQEVLTIGKAKDGFGMETTFATRTVILHPGPKVVPRHIEPKSDITTDWLVTTWRGSRSGRSGLHVQVDVWVGGRIKLDELQIPADFTVESGREIEEFVERFKSK